MKLNNSALLRNKAFINNEWVDAKSKETFPVLNPYNLEEIVTLPELTEIETKHAIDAAEAAFQTWKDVAPSERAEILNCWADLMQENQDDLAMLLTSEQGKTLSEASAEVGWSIAHIRYCANDTLPVFGKMFNQVGPDKQSFTVRAPFGVVASIAPWNFPLLIAIEKTAYPIAAGNTVVLKPSDETPLTSLAVAYLAEKAGLPKGVLNVVVAKKAPVIGNELTSNPKVKMLTFTGSTKVGKLLAQQAASTVKKVNLELGGNSPLIVFEDADIDAAVNSAIGLKFLNCGQVCINLNRLYVHEAVMDEFVEKFTAQAKQVTLGSGLDTNCTLGPLNNTMSIKKVEALVNDAVSKDANIVLGGKKREDLGPLFFEPTVLTNMNATMELFTEEVFGPVAPIYSFKDEAEVLKHANDTTFGLAAYIYTNNLSIAWRMSLGIQSANVCVNSTQNYIGGPLGGFKESGVQGGSGKLNALEQFFDTKAVSMTML